MNNYIKRNELLQNINNKIVQLNYLSNFNYDENFNEDIILDNIYFNLVSIIEVSNQLKNEIGDRTNINLI